MYASGAELEGACIVPVRSALNLPSACMGLLNPLLG